jgi:flagellar hook assembly protein FlgD
LDDIYWDGGTTDITEDVTIVNSFELMQNYPNPFNPDTNISFSMHEASDVSIEIYNLKGQKVKTLFSDWVEAGEYSVSWNGTDKNNDPVSSGMYFYQMKTAAGVELKKCVLLK